jgi:hypothetical protein
MSALDVGPFIMFIFFPSRLVFYLIHFICVFFCFGKVETSTTFGIPIIDALL